uniref:Light-regulated protein n=1 Tax=Zea mays TaxID=4577 RepID=B6SZ11_MAIZE|nr:hypothetical protein [Zea mays]
MQAAATAAGFSAVLPVSPPQGGASAQLPSSRPRPRRSTTAQASRCSRWRPATCLVATRATGPCSRKLKPASAAAAASRSVVGVDRDYLSYDEPKTVFPGEACDDLGGEFCEAPYQDGVSRELAHA